MEVAPFFVDFHHFLSIFTIFYRFSRFTHFCRNLRTFSAIFFCQNSLLRNITRFLHLCIRYISNIQKKIMTKFPPDFILSIVSACSSESCHVPHFSDCPRIACIPCLQKRSLFVMQINEPKNILTDLSLVLL